MRLVPLDCPALRMYGSIACAVLQSRLRMALMSACKIIASLLDARPCTYSALHTATMNWRILIAQDAHSAVAKQQQDAVLPRCSCCWNAAQHFRMSGADPPREWSQASTFADFSDCSERLLEYQNPVRYVAMNEHPVVAFRTLMT